MIPLISSLLFAVGVWLLFSRDWLRSIIGVSLAGQGVNLTLLMSGGATTQDPLPQALVLTAIVIGFGLQAFLLYLGIMYFKHHSGADTDHLKEVEE
ncbi:MAG: sodium:proton antiporter [Bdellovibrio sp.]